MKSYKDARYEQLRKSGAHALEGEELRRLQQTLLEMYLDVQAVCEENGLTCFVEGGTTLGTVRHQGFIPWDDDLDMGLLRDDYEKLKAIFREKLGDKYILNAPNYEGKPTNRFPKILKRGTRFVEAGIPEDERSCIKIDIFPLDNCPDNPVIRLLKGLCCTFLMFAGGHVLSWEMCRTLKAKPGRREVIGMLFSFCSSEKWFNWSDRACRHGNNRSRDLCIPTGRKHYFGEIYPRNVVEPFRDAVFEGHTVKTAANTDYVLTNLYGSYMEIPPEEKREKHYIDRIEF